MSSDWQRYILASSGYLELGMLDDAALALEKIAPPDKDRVEVLGVHLALELIGRKWQSAASIAGHLVNVMPENPSWWIQMAYAVRRCESIEKAEAILLEAHEIHPDNVIIMLNLASYASVTGRTEEAKIRLRRAIKLDRGVRQLALEVADLRPLWDWISGLD